MDSDRSGIFRTVKDHDYEAISHEPFEDPRLSWEARGVLAYLLCKPDHWIVRNRDLVEKGSAGAKMIERILAELKKFGYLRRYKYRTEEGTFEWVTQVFESPDLNPDHHTPQNGVWTIPPSTTYGQGGYIAITHEANTQLNINTKSTPSTSPADAQADLQEIAYLIRAEMGGGGDEVRAARELYFEHRGRLGLRAIAEIAVGESGPSEGGGGRDSSANVR